MTDEEKSRDIIDSFIDFLLSRRNNVMPCLLIGVVYVAVVAGVISVVLFILWILGII